MYVDDMQTQSIIFIWKGVGMANVSPNYCYRQVLPETKTAGTAVRKAKPGTGTAVQEAKPEISTTGQKPSLEIDT